MSANTLTEGAAQTGLKGLADQLSPQSVVRFNEPLAPHTTLRVGGPADVWIAPASEADLAFVLRFCSERKLPVFVLGRGSNLLVKDRGVRGIVVALNQPCFSGLEVIASSIRCGAGLRLKAVAVEAKRNELAGLEFLEGIPGTVGGALRMNAGAMGRAIFDVVASVRLMTLAGKVEERESAALEVKYRECTTLRTHIALGATLNATPGRREEIEQRMQEFSRKRWTTQPAAPSAGCMFKNPLTVPAGKLIDELGLKGTQVGGAKISLEHGNFLVNEGSATAQDILTLIDLIRSRARIRRGIELETEVEIIGE